MKTLAPLGVIAALALFTLPACTQANDTASAKAEPSTSALQEQDRIEQANAKLVTDFYDLAFKQRKPREAAERYFGPSYIQHNPFVADGAEAFSSFFEGFFRANPEAKSTVHRVMADKDLVALHLHMQASPSDRGSAVIDIFRVENGKIVEHWDVVQEVPETTANGHTMFDSLKTQ